MSDTLWKSRIVESGEKPASSFTPNDLNWRTHPERQRAALRSVLSRIGWVSGVIINRTTGHVIDGHARIEEALEIDPAMPVPYQMVELTEAEEKEILLVLDTIGDAAEADESAVARLLELVDLDQCEDLLALVRELPGSDAIALVPEFEPGTLAEQGKLDELNKIVCPNCGHEFDR